MYIVCRMDRAIGFVFWAKDYQSAAKGSLAAWVPRVRGRRQVLCRAVVGPISDIRINVAGRKDAVIGPSARNYKSDCREIRTAGPGKDFPQGDGP